MAVPTLAPLRSRPRSVTTTTEAPPLLSIIIVNYRRWPETSALVQQLVAVEPLHRERVELLVIDNASPFDPLEEAVLARPQVVVRQLPDNRGFSAGVNAGLVSSRGRWVLVLNPDLVVCDGFVDLICAAVREIDEAGGAESPVGVVGFQLRNRDGSPQLSTGFFPTLGKLLLGLLRPRARRKYQQMDAPQRQEVAWVTGSCLLARRACLHELGGFDEEYFLYYEDVDLCRRAQDQGWAVCYEPAVQAVHLDPLQNRPLTAPLWAITRHASLTYFRKHLKGWQFWSLAQIVRAEAWLRQRVAATLGDKDHALIARQVRGICRDLMRQRPLAARQRLEEVLRMSGMNTV